MTIHEISEKLLSSGQSELSMRELLDDSSLEAVSGGSEYVFGCSYICPLCNQKHTFNVVIAGGLRGMEITSYSACPQTAWLNVPRGETGNRLNVHSNAGNDYLVDFNEESMTHNGQTIYR